MEKMLISQEELQPYYATTTALLWKIDSFHAAGNIFGMLLLLLPSLAAYLLILARLPGKLQLQNHFLQLLPLG